MEQWPTKQELEALLVKKGSEALACYAWRGALRVLPLLGRQSINQNWSYQAIMRVYDVIRVHMLFYLMFGDNVAVTKKVFRAASAKAAEAYTAAFGYDNSPHINTANMSAAKAVAYAANAAANVNTNAYTVDAATAAAATADAYVANVTDAVYVAANITSYNARYVTLNYAYAAKAAQADLRFLLKDLNDVTRIYDKPLWWDDMFSPKQNEPQYVRESGQNLITNLTEMGLDFLATDILNLWQGKPLGPHAKNYLKDISDTELQTADDLRKFILGTEDTEANYAVRAILIGPGGSGKTSLSQLLTKGRTEQKISPTIGVNYQNHQPLDLTIHKDKIDQEQQQNLDKLKLYLWDFGGQAIFHSLHNAFMHENCVYILVVDSRHEQSPDEWLHQISAVTHNKGKVLLVTNWFDGINCQQNRLGLMRQFPQLLGEDSFFDFCCQSVEGAGFEAFINQLVATGINSQRQIFRSTRQAMDLVRDNFEQRNFIARYELEELLEENIDSDVNQLIDRLGEFGRFVSVDDDDQHLCVKPEWAIEKIYQLLYHDDVRSKGGMINSQDIRQVLQPNKQDKKDELARKVIAFMKKQQVCIQVNRVGSQADGGYFLPDAAKVDEPKSLHEIMQTPQRIILAYELPYLPIGLKAAMASLLITASDTHIDPLTDVWRDGIIVRGVNSVVDSKECVVLEYQARQQRIQLTVVGKPDPYLANLLKIIDQTLAKALSSQGSRQLMGHMVIDEVCDNWEQGGVQNNLNQDSIKGMLLDVLKSQGINLNIHQMTQLTDDSMKISNSTITHAAIGNNAKNQSNNDHSFNRNALNSQTTITAQQKADLQAVVKQALQEAVAQDFADDKTAVLFEVKKSLANVDGQLPTADNDQANSLIETLWQGLKELDATTSMAERGVKYLSPLVSLAVAAL